MDLILSQANVRGATYRTPEGQVLYRAKTDYKVSQRITTITKVVPNNSPEDMTDTYADLATIEWGLFARSKLHYGGSEYLMKDFLRSSGVLGQYRTFTVPGGQSFKWTLGVLLSTLEVDDGSRTPVAKMSRRRLAIFGKPRDKQLRIFPGFEHLADIILVTFVYIEYKRKERERASRSHGGGGGP